ncbi:MAG: hypothetical protein ACE5E6_08335, partial [Phycisphaerae bacterium]
MASDPWPTGDRFDAPAAARRPASALTARRRADPRCRATSVAGSVVDAFGVTAPAFRDAAPARWSDNAPASPVPGETDPPSDR